MIYDPSTNPLNAQEWIFPFLEVIHISSFAMSVGTIAVLDLKLLGLGMRNYTATQLWRGLLLWTIAGLAIVMSSGLLLFTTDPFRYYYNPAFRFKVLMLLIAIVFHYTAVRKVAGSKNWPGISAGAAAISIGLWASVVFGGIFYAFVA